VRDWSIYGKFHKLKHPGLGNQLRPFINDRLKEFLVRHIAIEIADVCSLTELQNDLIAIALNTEESKDLRSYAAMAVAHVGDKETKEKLRPLAEDPNDIEGRLKGWALKALWPDLITANKLFELLDAPAEGYAGSYTTFLSSDFLEGLKNEDLPVALTWVEQQEGHHLDYYLQKIVDQIMFMAWDRLAEPVILDAFATAALSRLRRHTPIVADQFESWGLSTASPAEEFQSILTADVSKRRTLIAKLISLMTEPDDLLHSLSLITNVVRKTDLEWIVGQARNSENAEVKMRWAKLLWYSYDPHSADDFNIVFFACEEQPELRDQFRYELTPVVLGSHEAQQMRTNWEMTHGGGRKPTEKPAIDPPITERIEGLLERCEAADWEAWWRLNYLIRFEPDGTTQIHDSENDLTAMPGWGNATPVTRNRMVAAAKGYIMARDDTPAEWLKKWLIYYPAYAGFRALHLISTESLGFLEGLGADVWKSWATIITLFPIDQIGEGSKSETDIYLMKQAYTSAPEEVINALMALVDQQNIRDGFFTIPAKIRDCIDERLADALLLKARQADIRPSTFHTLLEAAVEHNAPGAREFAGSFLQLPLSTEDVAREKILRATDILLDDPKRMGWSLIWNAMRADIAYCQAVMERSSSVYRTEKPYRWEHHLTECELADLYILALKTFPLSEDPHPVGFHGISQREMITRWREGLLDHLKSRATTDASNAVARIVEVFPDYQYLKDALIDAQDLARRNTWSGIDPKHIFELVKSNRARLVENGEQLLSVIIESLQRFQQRLHDETPGVNDLWNEPTIPGTKGREICYTPKGEEAFSNVLKRHLDSDLRERGVVVNREVVIRKSERTDIHVDAISKQTRNPAYALVKVIIEVKGCWNQDIEQSMETQLVNRYLKDNSCQHGLYVVGWFCCDQWHSSDYRRNLVAFTGIEQASEYFDGQAKSLSTGGTDVEALIIDASLR